MCSDKGVGRRCGEIGSVSRTDYLPPDPPGYEKAVILLFRGQLRLIALGMPMCYLDEDAMVWRELP